MQFKPQNRILGIWNVFLNKLVNMNIKIQAVDSYVMVYDSKFEWS
jgi:hypothetical protein